MGNNEDNTFPALLCHAGQCGYIADVSFEVSDIRVKKRWVAKCEELRQKILTVEAGYKERFGQHTSVLIRV